LGHLPNEEEDNLLPIIFYLGIQLKLKGTVSRYRYFLNAQEISSLQSVWALMVLQKIIALLLRDDISITLLTILKITTETLLIIFFSVPLTLDKFF
jgi:hypothetical protein